MGYPPRMTPVDFFFDPGCPWTWLTSRWLVAASAERDLAITWRPYSLKMKNGDEIPKEHRATVEASHEALRVVVALDASISNDAAGRFYTERGYRAFGGEGAGDAAGTLTAAGLDPAFAGASDDESHDAVIETSMKEAHRLAGDGSGSPILSVEGTERGYFGPVLTALPADPGHLWDLVLGLTAIPEVHELKRDRDTAPSFPARS